MANRFHNIGQLGGFLGRLLGSLAKDVLIWLGLTSAATTIDAAIPKKMFESGTTAIITLNEEMNDIMKRVKSLEKPDLLIKDISKTFKIVAKKLKGRFLNVYQNF